MFEVECDVQGILRVLEKFPDQASGVINNLIEDTARLLISSSGKVPGLVQVTPPFNADNQGKDAKVSGERAVTRDIARVYATPGAVFDALRKLGKGGAAKAFWKAMQRQDIASAQKIVENTAGLPYHLKVFRKFDDGAAHKARRGRGGRVVGKYPEFVVTNPAQLKRYRLKRMRNVGLLASGWVSDAGKLGQVRGVPSWVKRHSAPFGVVRKFSDGKNINISIINNAPYAGPDEQRRADYVLSYRLAALKRQTPYIAKRLEAKLDEQLRLEISDTGVLQLPDLAVA